MDANNHYCIDLCVAQLTLDLTVRMWTRNNFGDISKETQGGRILFVWWGTRGGSSSLL